MFELYTDKRGKWRWRFIDVNTKDILFASSQGYTERRDADRCILRAKGSTHCVIIVQQPVGSPPVPPQGSE